MSNSNKDPKTQVLHLMTISQDLILKNLIDLPKDQALNIFLEGLADLAPIYLKLTSIDRIKKYLSYSGSTTEDLIAAISRAAENNLSYTALIIYLATFIKTYIEQTPAENQDKLADLLTKYQITIEDLEQIINEKNLILDTYIASQSS